MLREASLLRCSKLSCYAEFNRMVQAIVRNASNTGFQAMPALQNMQGTSAEYCFYHTLAMMLRDIVSNTNPIAQKEELERVYKWFCINKPLIGTKTKLMHRKPVLSFKSRPSELDRPQTAPASLYLHLPSSTMDQRPHTTPIKPHQSFTSSYMSRSLERDLELVGRPLDQLVSFKQNHSREHRRQTVSPTPRPATTAASVRHRSRPLGSAGRDHNTPSVVSFPSADSLSGEPQRPATVDIGTLFALAPSVAAQMTLDRSAQVEQHKLLSRPTTQAYRIQPVNAPNNSPSPCPPTNEDDHHSTATHETAHDSMDKPEASYSTGAEQPMPQSTTAVSVEIKEIDSSSHDHEEMNTNSEGTVAPPCSELSILGVGAGQSTAIATPQKKRSFPTSSLKQPTRVKGTLRSPIITKQAATDQSTESQASGGRFIPYMDEKSTTFLTISSLERSMSPQQRERVQVFSNDHKLKATSPNREGQESPGDNICVGQHEERNEEERAAGDVEHLEPKKSKDTRAKPKTSKDKAEVHSVTKRSQTPLAIVTLSLGQPQHEHEGIHTAQKTSSISTEKQQHHHVPVFAAGFRRNRYRSKTVPSCANKCSFLGTVTPLESN